MLVLIIMINIHSTYEMCMVTFFSVRARNKQQTKQPKLPCLFESIFILRWQKQWWYQAYD